MNRSTLLSSLTTVSLVGLSGCFGPIYHRPTVENSATFKEAPVVSTTTAAVTWEPANPSDASWRAPWWTAFGDVRLNGLEFQVLNANQNIKQAEAQYREASALVTYNRASYFPQVTANPAATRGFGPSGGARSSSKLGTFNDFNMPLNASWEPNFWNRVGLSVRNAAASAQASASDLQTMRLSMEAELASDYFTLETFDLREALLTSAVDSYQKALQLTNSRYGSGLSSKADVVEAQAQLENAQAQATDVALSRAQYEHAIAVLVGQAPANFSLSSATVSALIPRIPPGLPAQLLERRPDISSAERQVAAANANVGLARVAYFPAITLSATGGYESGTFVDWFNWANRYWSVGASAAQTVLDFGHLRAQRYQANAAYDAAVAGYRQTVLAAFQEVEDNLAALRLLEQEAAQEAAAVSSGQTALTLEMGRYSAGIDSFLDVITTQNTLLTDQENAADVLGRRMTAAVTLIRALGGGWDESLLPQAGDISASSPVPGAEPKR